MKVFVGTNALGDLLVHCDAFGASGYLNELLSFINLRSLLSGFLSMSPRSSKNRRPKIRSRRSFSPGQWPKKCSTDLISSSSSQLLHRSLLEIPSRIAIYRTAMCPVMISTSFRRLCLLNSNSFSIFSLLRLGHNVLEIKQPSWWEFLVVICSWIVFKG